MTGPSPAIGAVLVTVAVLLGGCNTSRPVAVADDYPRDVRQRHPIVLQERDRVVEIFVGHKRGGLTPPQRADVLAFAQAWKREATSGVLIGLPTGTPNARAAAESVREIKSIFHGAGLPTQGVAVRPYFPADPEKLATIRIQYAKIAATAGPCGLWPDDLGIADREAYQQNRPYWNFGCASQRNLAAMVDNPADLVQPRGESPSYTPRRSVMLDKYRKGESTATIYPDASQAKISDVGK